jgi:outer membrane protein OmpA-like peptidoglycan-associated protein
MRFLDRRRAAPESEEHWISVSDLMSGLMVIFLFIAVSYLRPVIEQREKIREIVVTYQATEAALIERLNAEFAADLTRWQAELDRRNLAVRFNAPEVLFRQGSADLQPRFQQILAEFVPRYLRVLSEFRDGIEEIRIEGHTSSDWAGALSVDDAYFRNMELSQARTRQVLRFAMALPDAREYRQWALQHVTANGLSSSQRVLLADGREDADRSRRVESRVRTKAKDQIVRILETVQP